VRVGGVDGCRGGWLLATAPATRRAPVRLEVLPTFAPIAAAVRDGDLAAVAVDMPIGLPDAGTRPCDVAARALLGPRRSSVFPAPVRSVLGARDYADALARSRAVDGRGLSVQAYNLLPRIADLDACVDPSLQERIVEAHPELCFAELAGRPLPASKRTAAGRAARAALVGTVPPVPRGAAVDDVLDAMALLTTAERLLRGRVRRLGGELDGRCLRMEIVT
jgi:predicted RNase H-like nuclease